MSRGLFCEALQTCYRCVKSSCCICNTEPKENQRAQLFNNITIHRQPGFYNSAFGANEEEMPPRPAPRPQQQHVETQVKKEFTPRPKPRPEQNNVQPQGEYVYADDARCGEGLPAGDYYYEEPGKAWYALQLTRQECDQMLKSQPTRSGKFLIRNCLSRPGNSVLSVLTTPDRVCHYIIFEENSNFFIELGKCFPSILELVLHYREHDSDRICMLTVPCTMPLMQVPRAIPHQFDGLIIGRTNLKHGEVLGKGKFGTVRKGKLLNSFDVAIKQANRAVNVQDFMEEAAMLAKLQHRRIVHLYGVVNDDYGDFLIVTELMIHGDLLKYMRRLGDSFEHQDQITVMIQVVAGMTYLEEKQVIHRDLRAANVLVGENSVYKIGDLGLAKLIDNQHCNMDAPLAVRWTAPEVLQFPNNDHTHKSDVWSFGVLLYEIATRGGEPWKGLEKHEVKRRVVDGNFLEKPDDCDELLYSLMTNCWGLTVEERPTFLNLKELLLDNYGHQDEPNFANEQQPRDSQS